MPSKHAAFVEYVAQDLLAELDVTSRPMFGGHGLYHVGKIFGIEADGRLYFKVNAINQADYEAAGSEPFRYSSKDRKAVTMSYWQVPDDVLEKRGEVVIWARKAITVSQQAKKR